MCDHEQARLIPLQQASEDTEDPEITRMKEDPTAPVSAQRSQKKWIEADFFAAGQRARQRAFQGRQD